MLPEPRGQGTGGGGGASKIAPAWEREGVSAIRDFVRRARWLLNGATALPVDRLGIGVRNVWQPVTKEFWCPGSTLKVKFDNTNPLAYGMPSRGRSLFDSPAFDHRSGR
jgi:hypothetical protein